MARKYGKRNKIKDSIFDYNVGLIGESGIGKTTLAIEVAEKVVGEDGYLLFSIGKEDAVDAIGGAMFEEIEDWAKLEEVTDDIIENKNTDWKDLKVIIYDTIDELNLLAEAEVVRLWNKKNPSNKVDTVSAAFGGFQRGEKKVVELVVELMWKLKRVGVSMFPIGHTKRKTKTDPVTLADYDVLTTDLPDRFFNAIKNKLHVLGVVSVDRTINKKVTKDRMGLSKTVNSIEDANRVITFRDENYTIESKSRFDGIVPEIELDSDKFIKAIKDAIEVAKEEQKRKGRSHDEVDLEKIKNENLKVEQEIIEKNKTILPEKNLELFEVFKSQFIKVTDDNIKAEIKKVMAEYGITSLNDEVIENVKTEAFEKIVELSK